MPEQSFPAQNNPEGAESKMNPRPRAVDADRQGSGKLRDKVAIVTGGDSGIGRAVAVAFAGEGADVAVVYHDQSQDAAETKRLVEERERRCLTISGDVGDEEFCRQAVRQTLEELGKLDILNSGAPATAATTISFILAGPLRPRGDPRSRSA